MDDLAMALSTFPNESLNYLKDNTHRLIRGVYERGEHGCLFNMLSRPLENRISSKEDLSFWFTGDRGEELRETSPLYLSARRVVQSWDGRRLSIDTVLFVVDQLLKGAGEVFHAEREPAIAESPVLSLGGTPSVRKSEVQQELALPF